MMSWHEFIFSKKNPHRHMRHIAFWMMWWLYFFSARYLIPQLAPMTQKIEYVNFATSDFLQSLLILFIQMLGCYVVINILLSRFLLKGKYLLFAASIILLSTAIVIATHFVNVALIPFLDNVILNNKVNAVNKTTYWFSISNGGINFIKIITTAMVIKVAKRWWFKQKEKERLEKEKIDTELQLLKAQIHPGFLFNSLQPALSC